MAKVKINQKFGSKLPFQAGPGLCCVYHRISAVMVSHPKEFWKLVCGCCAGDHAQFANVLDLAVFGARKLSNSQGYLHDDGSAAF